MTSEFDPYLEWLGIEPQERPANHYRLLGVAPGEPNLVAIRLAADDRMAFVRSMQNGPRAAETQQILNELSAARVCLLDETAKAEYDRWLAAGGWSTGAPAPAAENHMLPPSAAAPAAATPTDVHQRDMDPDRARSFVRTLAVAGVFVATVVVCVLVGMLLGPSPEGSADRPDPQLADNDSEPDPRGASDRDDGVRESIVIAQEGSGVINLPVSVASQQAGEFTYELEEDQTVLAGWSEIDQWLSWRFRVTQTGQFRVEVSYSITADGVGGKYTLAIDDDQKECTVNSEAARAPVTDEHRLDISERGEHRLIMRASAKPGLELLRLRSVRLAPVEDCR